MEAITAASTLLDLIERANRSGEKLPVPSFMRRLNERLTEHLVDCGVPSHVEDSLHTFLADREIGDFRENLKAIVALKTPVYTDVLFLMSDRGPVAKEVSITCLGSDRNACITLKSPPYCHRTDHHGNDIHGIGWEDGVISGKEIRDTVSELFNCSRKVYVQGMEKLHILSELFQVPHQSFVVLGTHPCLRDLRNVFRTPPCRFHEKRSCNLACAKRHTEGLKMFYEKKHTSQWTKR